MIMEGLTTGMLGVNTYFLINEQTKQAIIIDGGENYKKITDKANELGVKIVALLLTHSHFDHSGNAAQFQRDGVKVYISQRDNEKIQKNEPLFEKYGKAFDSLTADYMFSDNEVLEIAGIKIKVLLTPGHTDGGACFIVDDMLFSGDTLFCQSIGRTDFPTGSFSEIAKSIKRLYNLGVNYKVYPGHGEYTTIEQEKKYNPYVRA